MKTWGVYFFKNEVKVTLKQGREDEPKPDLRNTVSYKVHWTVTLQHRPLKLLALLSLPPTLEKRYCTTKHSYF